MQAVNMQICSSFCERQYFFDTVLASRASTWKLGNNDVKGLTTGGGGGGYSAKKNVQPVFIENFAPEHQNSLKLQMADPAKSVLAKPEQQQQQQHTYTIAVTSAVAAVSMKPNSAGPALLLQEEEGRMSVRRRHAAAGLQCLSSGLTLGMAASLAGDPASRDKTLI